VNEINKNGGLYRIQRVRIFQANRNGDPYSSLPSAAFSLMTFSWITRNASKVVFSVASGLRANKNW